MRLGAGEWALGVAAARTGAAAGRATGAGAGRANEEVGAAATGAGVGAGAGGQQRVGKERVFYVNEAGELEKLVVNVLLVVYIP